MPGDFFFLLSVTTSVLPCYIYGVKMRGVKLFYIFSVYEVFYQYFVNLFSLVRPRKAVVC